MIESTSWRWCGDIINTMMIMFNKCLKFHVLMMRWWGVSVIQSSSNIWIEITNSVSSFHFWSILMLQAVMRWPGENSGYSDLWPRMKVNHKLTILKMNDSRKKTFSIMKFVRIQMFVWQGSKWFYSNSNQDNQWSYYRIAKFKSAESP